MSFLHRIFGIRPAPRPTPVPVPVNPPAPAPVPRPAPRPVVTAPALYRLPAEWMPSSQMNRIHLHWTGGSYVASSHDRNCYHFLVEGDENSTVIRGTHPVTANEHIGNKTSDHYAAHTRMANTRSIGLAVCAMARAQERPFDAGRFPLLEGQWQRAAEVAASLCRRYNIPVTDRTVLTHAEVQPNLGIAQNGKWDIIRLPFAPNLIGAQPVGDDFRRRVSAALARL